MPKYQYTKLQEVEARGGLSQENISKTPGLASEGHTPTRPGRFTILSVEKHVSGGRWLYSTIPWGTPVRVDADAVYIKLNGAWKKLSSTDPRWLAPYRSFPKPELELRKAILDYYKTMAASFGTAIPDTWVFNDFGHISVKYYRDNDHNGVFDKKKDELMSDFIHTTPPDEASTAYINRHQLPDNINLSYSHGCIHIKPNDIDRLIRTGYVRRGIIIEVHPYSAVVNIPVSFLSNTGGGPHELHFFPAKSTDMNRVDGKGKLVVYKVTKLS
jgi:hypothetical protein